MTVSVDEISKGGIVAILVLQRLESVGISATLRYEIARGNERPFGQSRWFVFATLQRRHHFDASFSEADVHLDGVGVRFAARTCERIEGELRRMAGGAAREKER